MDTKNHKAAIDDDRTPKDFNDPTLSPRAKEIVKRVAKMHARWLELAQWGGTALGRDPDKLTTKEAMAVEAYYNLRKKVTWPLWSTHQTDQQIQAQIFAIQATYSRIKRLVPDSFSNI